jgi:AcrR family transcriptional regulator
MNSDSKIVKQPRAVRTRAKLLGALERLLKEREFERISIVDIAGEAGVAVGSVYSHFSDKNAFLDALLEERFGTIARRLAESGKSEAGDEPETLRAAIDLAVRSAYAQVMEDAHILRALHTYARLSGTEHPAGRTLARAAFDGILAYLKRYDDEIVVQDITQAAKVVHYMLNTAFLDRVLVRGGSLPEETTPDDASLCQALSSMLTGYLKSGQ